VKHLTHGDLIIEKVVVSILLIGLAGALIEEVLTEVSKVTSMGVEVSSWCTELVSESI